MSRKNDTGNPNAPFVTLEKKKMPVSQGHGKAMPGSVRRVAVLDGNPENESTRELAMAGCGTKGL